MTRKINPLLLTAMAALPLSTISIHGETADAAAKSMAAQKKKTPTPKPASKKAPAKHKHKKKTPTPTPKPKAKKKPAAPKPTATATPRPTATPSATNGTFTGPSVDMRWGPVQATVTISGHKLTDVQIDTHPDTARSQMIDSRAVPVLRQETLQAQSAQIDDVSGATQTSEAYMRSLQGALDKANF